MSNIYVADTMAMKQKGGKKEKKTKSTCQIVNRMCHCDNSDATKYI